MLTSLVWYEDDYSLEGSIQVECRIINKFVLASKDDFGEWHFFKKMSFKQKYCTEFNMFGPNFWYTVSKLPIN